MTDNEKLLEMAGFTYHGEAIYGGKDKQGWYDPEGRSIGWSPPNFYDPDWGVAYWMRWIWPIVSDAGRKGNVAIDRVAFEPTAKGVLAKLFDAYGQCARAEGITLSEALADAMVRMQTRGGAL